MFYKDFKKFLSLRLLGFVCLPVGMSVCPPVAFVFPSFTPVPK